MRKNILAGAAVALLAMSGSAFAGDQYATTQLQLDVENSCTLEAPALINGGTLSVAQPSSIRSDNLKVVCPTLTAYSLGTAASLPAGNQYAMLNATSDASVAYNILKEDGVSAFGAVADGEDHAGIGTGSEQSIPFQVAFNVDAAGAANRVPKADSYTGQIYWVLSN